MEKIHLKPKEIKEEYYNANTIGSYCISEYSTGIFILGFERDDGIIYYDCSDKKNIFQHYLILEGK